MQLQVGEDVAPQLLCSLVPSDGFDDGGWVAMPAIFCRLRQSYMDKIRSPEMGLPAVVYMVSTVAQDKSPRGVDYWGRRVRQRGRLLVTHSLVPPAGAVVNARSGHRAYLARDIPG